MPTPDDLRLSLDLAPLPVEGGWFRVTHADEHSSAIYYLLARGEFSALHVLDSDETYHFYAGAALSMLLLHPDGTVSEPLLGNDIDAGENPQLRIPAGTWQGSAGTGEFSLVGTTMAPPFDRRGCRFGRRDELVTDFPDAAARIAELTPP